MTDSSHASLNLQDNESLAWQLVGLNHGLEGWLPRFNGIIIWYHFKLLPTN